MPLDDRLQFPDFRACLDVMELRKCVERSWEQRWGLQAVPAASRGHCQEKASRPGSREGHTIGLWITPATLVTIGAMVSDCDTNRGRGQGPGHGWP